MTTIERAARVLCQSLGENPDEEVRLSAPTFQGSVLAEPRASIPTMPLWRARIASVRAVISAIREPSDTIVEAGYLARADGDTGAAVWTAQIDALLEEGK